MLQSIQHIISFRACLEVAFGDKKCQFFVETRRFLKYIPLGTDKKSNEVSAKKRCFLAQRVTSKQALSALLEGSSDICLLAQKQAFISLDGKQEMPIS